MNKAPESEIQEDTFASEGVDPAPPPSLDMEGEEEAEAPPQGDVEPDADTPPVPFMAGGKLVEGMPESIKNAPPPKAPPDFSAFRKKPVEAAPPPEPKGGDMEDLDYDPFEDEDEDARAADLLTFLRQWTYSPGLSYISIRRMSPVQFRNFSTGGYLEDIHDPFDESWLAQRWGGGTFVVDVFQYSQGTGRSQRVEGRSVTISGPPLYYRGPDGNPAPIPGMAQQPNGNGAWNQGGYGGAPPASPFGAPTGGWGQARPTFGQAQPQSTSRTPGYMPNAADVLNRNQQDVAVMNMVKDTVESSAAGQVAAVQAQTETLRSELARERQEARRSREKEGSAISSMWQPVQSTIASVQDQLRTQADGHRAQMDALRQQSGEEMRAREEAHRREMDAMRLQNDGQLRAKDEDHRRYMDDLRERHRHEVDGLRDEMRRGEERGSDRVRQTEQMILARFEAQLAAAKDAADRAEREADRRVSERDVEIARIRD